MIDLRSDTLTQPTAGMRRAIAEAVCGDEQAREDPTVTELEERAASLLGQEEAVFVPTATMANQIALRLLSEPGDEVLAEALAHVFRYELGGPAVHSGLAMKRIHTDDGRFTAEQVREAVTPRGNVHTAPSTVLCVENTHNGGGGRVWPIAQVGEIVAVARELDLRLHLDGARLMNAAIASGVSAREYGRHFDTVTLCLSKGLGCPLGALLAGSRERMGKARRFKHLFGGAMRQAGVVAAAGIYALDNHVARLAEDHANATRLGARLAAAGLPVDPEQIESNFVFLDVASVGVGTDEALAALRVEGVLLSLAAPKGVLRALTHLDVSTPEIDEAAERIARALRRWTESARPSARGRRAAAR